MEISRSYLLPFPDWCATSCFASWGLPLKKYKKSRQSGKIDRCSPVKWFQLACDVAVTERIGVFISHGWSAVHGNWFRLFNHRKDVRRSPSSPSCHYLCVPMVRTDVTVYPNKGGLLGVAVLFIFAKNSSSMVIRTSLTSCKGMGSSGPTAENGKV